MSRAEALRPPPRQTSLDAWQRIQEEGLLRQAEQAVYGALFRSEAGLTRNELDRQLAPGQPNAPYSRRLAEMERSGAVRRVGARGCAVSGHTCEVWDVTDGIPVRAEPEAAPPMPTTEQAPALAREVEQRIADVRRAGCEPSEALLVLHAWLAAGAPAKRGRRGVTAGPAPSPAEAAPAPPVAPPPVDPPVPSPARPRRLDRHGQGLLY